MKKIILLVIASIILSGCLKPTTEKPEGNNQSSPEVKSSTSTLIDQQTQGWQEYENQELGYKLKFPQDWHLTDNPQARTNLSPGISFISLPVDQLELDHARFTVLVEESKQWNLDSYPPIENLEKDGYNKSHLELNNTPAYFLITSDTNKDLVVIFTQKDGYFYRLNWNATTPKLRHDYQEIFKQILATFDFIDLPKSDHLWI
jgi:photosystem II reaction center protein PsbP